MRRIVAGTLGTVGIVLSLYACASPDSMELPTEFTGSEALFDRFDGSEWSSPVHLDAPVNSAWRELGADLSPDGRSLYFGSDRPGGLGAFDIWVSRRACLECAWEQPANLGPNINSAAGDGGAALSVDGHLLFFSGARDGGLGGEDIWMSRRTDTNDDLSWEPATNLGPMVNTAANESGTGYAAALAGGGANLYFSRGGDIYHVPVTRHGIALEPAVPVTELNHPTAMDAEPTIRADGREVFFWSNSLRGGVGGSDIWVATRRSLHHPWSPPENLGNVNTPFAQLSPGISHDGRTLFVALGFQGHGGLGFQDIWMYTRRESR